MEGVQLKDISIQLGYPYLFLHYGNCEHILVFTELRTFHPELDSMIRAEYPVTLYQLHQRKKKCKICDIYSAAWITIDDPLAPENPCFFCRDCYRSVHTNFLGNPIYSADHLVYQYITE